MASSGIPVVSRSWIPAEDEWSSHTSISANEACHKPGEKDEDGTYKNKNHVPRHQLNLVPLVMRAAYQADPGALVERLDHMPEVGVNPVGFLIGRVEGHGGLLA